MRRFSAVDVIASFSAALRIDFSRATASMNRSDVIKRMIAVPGDVVLSMIWTVSISIAAKIASH
jgi:hypothetical protein